MDTGVNILTLILPFCHSNAFLWRILYVQYCVRVNHPHVKYSVSAKFPKVSDHQVYFVLQVYCRHRQIVDLVWLGQQRLTVPYGAIWVSNGVVVHVGGHEGLAGQVSNPAT